MGSDDDSSQKVIEDRANPFTPFEKSLLFELINSKKNVIESKESDYGSHRSRRKAWADIALKFQSTNGASYRTEAQLKRFWSNCKVRAKKKVTMFVMLQQTLNNFPENDTSYLLGCPS